METITTTNNLRTSATYHKRVNGEARKYIINFALNDECKNGEEDFKASGVVFRKSTGNGHWYRCGWGQCWDEVYDLMPKEFQNICDLHMNRFDGRPMYAIENGWYYIQEGKRDVVKRHFMLTDEETEQIMGCMNDTQVYIFILDHNLVKRWKDKADAAIATLEKCQGVKFVSKATRPNPFNKFTPEMVAEERAKMTSDFYSAENCKRREEERYEQAIQDVKKEIMDKANERVVREKFDRDVTSRVVDTLIVHRDEIPHLDKYLKDFIVYISRIDGYANSVSFGHMMFSHYRVENNNEIVDKMAHFFIKANEAYLRENNINVEVCHNGNCDSKFVKFIARGARNGK